MKIVALLALVAALAGCGVEPEATEQTSNPAVSVEKLFEKDGYTVHRFRDGSHWVYYVTPVGQAYTEYSRSCGKNCTKTERVSAQTVAP